MYGPGKPIVLGVWSWGHDPWDTTLDGGWDMVKREYLPHDIVGRQYPPLPPVDRQTRVKTITFQQLRNKCMTSVSRNMDTKHTIYF